MDLLFAFVAGVVAVPVLVWVARRLDWRAAHDEHMGDDWLRGWRYVAAKRELRTPER